MIRFSRYIWLYILISASVLVPGVYSLVIYGLRPSVDFTGGTLLELKFDKDIGNGQIEAVGSKAGVAISSFQKTSGNTFLLRLKSESEEKIPKFQEMLTKEASRSYEVLREESVGPVLGKELLGKAAIAAGIAILGILLYVAWAFKNVRFGVSAILALVHDLLVVVGCFSLFGHYFGVEVDTLFVTAFLTTMSFSVHDTIVVFDRIREMTKKGVKMPFEDMCDTALTETMGRSLINSLTIIFMLVALILLGGDTIRWFVVALLIGTISGTYSSPFVATPVLLLWYKFQGRFQKRKP